MQAQWRQATRATRRSPSLEALLLVKRGLCCPGTGSREDAKLKKRRQIMMLSGLVAMALALLGLWAYARGPPQEDAEESSLTRKYKHFATSRGSLNSHFETVFEARFGTITPRSSVPWLSNSFQRSSCRFYGGAAGHGVRTGQVSAGFRPRVALKTRGLRSGRAFSSATTSRCTPTDLRRPFLMRFQGSRCEALVLGEHADGPKPFIEVS